MLIHFMKISSLSVISSEFNTYLIEQRGRKSRQFVLFSLPYFYINEISRFLINFQILMILNKWNNIQCQQLNNSINISILLFTCIEIFDHKLLKILKYLKFEITISFDKENVRSTKSIFIDLHFSLLAKNLIGMQKILII